MAKGSFSRRLTALESVILVPVLVEYPPFTLAELETIEKRAKLGLRFAREELARIEQHSPIVEGELLIRSYGGSLFVRRYIGLDLAEI
jgi:hypothetical protein